MIITYAGNRMDEPGRSEPRFPPSRMASVRRRVGQALTTHRTDLVVGAAAAGSDLIVASEALDRSIPVHLVLPLAIDEFRRRSVADQGEEWVALFDRVLSEASAVTVEDLSAHDDWYLRGNGVIIDTASAVAGDRVLTGLVVATDEPGSASNDFADRLRTRGHAVTMIDPSSDDAPAGDAPVADDAPAGDGAPWWSDAVVYQIYPRSFADSDGDGIGDLGGIIAHLDHLSALGVDVVWLSPIYPSPQDDNGYDISDYRNIDPLFGSLDLFDQLVAGLHQRGIKLVMDLVVNHTSDEHPWFVAARNPDDPKRDWYWWRPPRPGTEGGTDGAEPNDWGSFFAGSAWQYDDASGQYYLHLFSRKQPDLNWENPQVREAVYEMMRWWLDRGVDGFRMDVINLISKPVGPDGSLPEGPSTGGRWTNGSVMVANGPRIHEFLAEMNAAVFGGRSEPCLTVGETPLATLSDAQAYTDPARGEVDMIFQFEHMSIDHGPGGRWDPIPLDLVALKANLARWQEGLAAVGWNSLYWNNHDQPRAVSRFGDDDPTWWELSAKTLGTVLHLHRGTPYVYQGEELGMTNAPFRRLEDYQDIESVNNYRQAVAEGRDPAEVLAALAIQSRDHARTPMQWTDEPGAGFTTGTPWLAVNPNHVSINAASQVDDPNSVFAHYRSLIALRHREPVIARGDFTLLLPDHPTVWAIRRRLVHGAAADEAGDDAGPDDVVDEVVDEVIMVANLSRDPVTVEVAELADGWAETLLSVQKTDPVDQPDDGGKVTLGGWESIVVRTHRAIQA